MPSRQSTWPQWNVALWIANDPGLYALAKDHIKECANREQAARTMADFLHTNGHTHTPDGARFTKTSIRYAMREL